MREELAHELAYRLRSSHNPEFAFDPNNPMLYKTREILEIFRQMEEYLGYTIIRKEDGKEIC